MRLTCPVFPNENIYSIAKIHLELVKNGKVFDAYSIDCHITSSLVGYLHFFTEYIILLNDNSGIIRTADVVHAGISRTTLGTLVKNGNLERIAHGQYIRPDNITDELYLDATLRDIPLTTESIIDTITAICVHPIKDEVTLNIGAISPIRPDDVHGGYRVKLTAG